MKNVLTEIASTELDRADREHIERWLDDPRSDTIWKTISRRAQEHSGELFPRFFVYEVLACSKCARQPATPFRDQSEAAEGLASFLVGSATSPPPMPNIPNFEELACSLRQAAGLMRKQAELADRTGFARKSRKSKTSARVQFTLMISALVLELCGQPSHYEVGVLAEIAFPGDEVPDDLVRTTLRSAKRPRLKGK